MKLRSVLVSVASLALLALTVYAADEVKLDGIKCVMNPKAAAKADKTTKFAEGNVYFCCGNCCKKFVETSKEDEAVRAKGRGQLVATGQYEQKCCPKTGGPMKVTATINGGEIKFCCNNCKGAAEKDALVALGDKGFKKGFKLVKKEE